MVSASSTATLRVTAVRAEGLKNLQRIMDQDPFVELELDPWGHTAKTKAASGVNPVWKAKHNNVMELPYHGRPVPPTQAFLNVRVMDWEATRASRLIGAAEPVALDKIMKSEYVQEVVLDLADKEGNFAGTLYLNVEVVLKGVVEVTVVEGQQLKDLGQKLSAQENYVRVFLEAANEDPGVRPGGKTKIAYGLNPVFIKRNVMAFPYEGEDEPRLFLEVWDKEFSRKDRIVGRGAMMLTTDNINYRATPKDKEELTIELRDERQLPAGRLVIRVRFLNAAYDPTVEVVRGMASIGQNVHSISDVTKGEVDFFREFRVVALNLEEEMQQTAPDFVREWAKATRTPIALLASIFWLVVIASALVVLVLLGPKVLTIMVASLYPAYQSFKALESPQTDDDTQWLTYWVLFGLFEVVEQTLFALLRIINPVYAFFTFLFKIGFLIWMQHPTAKGALWLYRHYVGPWLRSNEQFVDKRILRAQETIKEIDDRIRLPVEKSNGDDADDDEFDPSENI